MGFLSLGFYALIIAFLFYTMDMVYKMSQDVIYIRKAIYEMANSNDNNNLVKK